MFMLDVDDRKYYTLFTHGMLPTESDLRSLLTVVGRDLSARGEELAGLDDISNVKPLLIAYNRLLARALLRDIKQEEELTVVELPDGRVLYSVNYGSFKISGVAPLGEYIQRINQRVAEALDVASRYS